jgi:hypothetical protein
MRNIGFALTAAASLLATPAVAGGDWDYWGHRYTWRGDYAPYYGPPVRYYGVPAYVPRTYVVPYGYPAYSDDYAYGEDCEIERKWRHGRLYEKIDCDD